MSREMATNIRGSNELLTSDYLASLAGLNRPNRAYMTATGLVQPPAAYVPSMHHHQLYPTPGHHMTNAVTSPQFLADRLIGNLSNLNLNQLGSGSGSFSAVNAMNNSGPMASDSINESLLRKENEIERYFFFIQH
jgi:hypothetical protein